MEDRIVCFCKNVTESTIMKAIENGARNINDLEWSTGACTGNKCAELNPSRICCKDELIKLLGDKHKPTCSCGCNS